MNAIEDLISPQLRFSKVFYVNVTDLEGNYLYVNELFVKKFGFITDDFLGKSFADIISADDIQKSIEASIYCIENPKAFVPIILKKPLPSGDYYYTQWEFSLLQNNKNEPIGIICIGFDMTIQEKQRDELLIKQKKAFLFFNNPDNDNLVLNLNGGIKEYNDRAKKSVKYYHNSVINEGDSLHNYLSNDYKADFWDDLEQVKKGKPVNREMFLTFESGEKAWHIISLTPVLNNSGEVFEIFFSVKNINPLKSALLTKKQLEAKLKDIVWEHSHSVRSPLSNLLAFTDLILTDDFDIDSDDLKYILKSIRSEALRLDEIIYEITNKIQADQSNK